MSTEDLELQGSHVRFEPLAGRHIDGLVTAAADDPSLYQWSPVPQGRAEVTAYVQTALAWRDAGSAVPFAIVRVHDGAVVGSTRFFDLEPGHGRRVTRHAAAMFPMLVKSATPGWPARPSGRRATPRRSCGC